MSAEPQLRTERLLLRRWRAADLRPCAAMNADPEVMEHFPAPLTGPQSAELIERIEAGFEQHGYGLCAVEMPARAPFVGFVGLSPVDDDLQFAPAVEVGWRLIRGFWGRGLATEAASAAIDFGFQALGLREIVSFTAECNLRSQRVMRRLGMRRDPDEDFDHPDLPPEHRLARHVLYRLDAARWAEGPTHNHKGLPPGHTEP